MNIKSLILGSAAALVAGGAAQAADLPVAEPVDYVKVCNAYGAGYHFIPGTDTCLKIGGFIRAEFQYDEPQARGDNTTAIAAKTEIHFTAKEETELGTLVGYAKLDSAGQGFDKYYLSIGGLYAGLTDSAATIDYTDQGFYGAGVGDHDIGAIGYNMDAGNGVTASIAIENSRRNTISGAAANYAGQALPDVVAALTVSQGWGAAKVAAAVHQIRYANASISTDYGYFFGAGLKFNLDMLSAGSNIAFTGGYAKGATAYIAGATTARGIGAAVANDDATITGAGTTATAKLNTVWELGATLKYAWASNFNTYLSGAYRNFNNETNNADYKSYNVGLTAEYLPVKNLIVRVGANYSKNDWSAASGNRDVDNWEGKLRLQRNF